MKNWLTFWRNRRPFDLERALRANRPKPPAQLVKAIVGDVRRRPAHRVRVGRAVLGATALAGLLVAVSVVAGLGASGGTHNALQHINVSRADASCTQYVQAPTIASVSQSSVGQAGDTITVTGTYLDSATTITINGHAVGSPSLGTFQTLETITFTVPAGSGAGQLVITNPCDTIQAPFTVIAAPSISHITASAPIGGQVTITGTGLTGTTSVAFTGAAATVFTVDSDTQITATVPSGATDGPITVTNAINHASSTSFHVGPRIASFTPDHGLVGAPVTITGDHFGAHPTVTFGGTAASSTTVNGAGTSITAIVGAGSASGPIAVTDASSAVATSATNFTVVQTPQIVSFSPTSGGPGTVVTITGMHFSQLLSAAFGKAAASFDVTHLTDTSVNVTVPAAATSGKITLTTAAGSGLSLTNFTVTTNPTVSSFTPAAASAGQLVSINGKFFTGVTGVTFSNNVPATSFSFVSDKQINATVPAGAVSGPVSVTTASGTTSSTPVQLTVYKTPTVSSFTPTSQGAGGQVTVIGTGFTGANLPHSGNGSCSTCGVTLVHDGASTDVSVATINSVSSDGTMLTFTIPTTAGVGTYHIKIATPAGANTLPGGGVNDLTVVGATAAPVVSTVSPSHGPANTQVSTPVVITGTGFIGTSAVRFGTVLATNITSITATEIDVMAPAGASTSPSDVTVTNPLGTSPKVLGDRFTADPAPVVIGFTPQSGVPTSITPAHAGQTVTISGLNFTGADTLNSSPAPGLPSCGVLFTGGPHGVCGTNVQVHVVGKGTTITVTVPSGAATGAITVTTPDGSAASAAQFIVVGGPTIQSFTPEVGKPGTVVTITGSGFLGGNTPTVTFGSVNALSNGVKVLSDTTLTAVVPTTTAPTPQTNVNGQIVVTNDFGPSAPSTDSFTLENAPTIAAQPLGLAPTHGPANTGMTTMVTITGTNFTGATSVTFGKLASPSFNVVSSTQITAFAPAGAVSAPITVTTPSGSASTVTFTVDVPPTISSFTPASPNGAVDGSSTLVTINGLHFLTPGTYSVLFTGPLNTTVTAPTPTILADNKMTTTVPSGAVTGPITVVNSATGQATSAASFIVIKPPTITGFTPGSGIVNTKVTVFGSGFSGGTTTVSFTNGTITKTAIAPASAVDTQTTVSVPAGLTPGFYNLVVHNATGSANDQTSADQFIFAATPQVTSLADGMTNGPASLQATTIVDVLGSGFNGATGVSFGGKASPFISVNSDTDITALVPPGAKTGAVVVTTPAGSSNAKTAPIFTVNPPPFVKTMAGPNGTLVAPVGGTVTLTGTGFVTGQGTLVASDPGEVTLDLVDDFASADTLTPPSPAWAPGSLGTTSLTFTVPAFAETGPVQLMNLFGETALAPGSLTIMQVPSVDSVLNYFDFSEAANPGSPVVIYGFGFTGATAVTFGTHPATSFAVVSDDEIIATLPKNFTSGSAGVAVKVTNPAGNDTGGQIFLPAAPTISSIVPNHASVGDTVQIMGTGLAGTIGITFNGVQATVFNYVSNTEVDAEVPATATTGPVRVTTEVGTSAPTSFTVDP